MEKDNELKNWLARGSEIASANFTDSIMDKIHGLSLNPSYKYQPLVSNKIKKTFIIAFGAVVSMIFLLSLIISAPELPFITSIDVSRLTSNMYYNILFFIISFWFVFAINSVLQKNQLKLH